MQVKYVYYPGVLEGLMYIPLMAYRYIQDKSPEAGALY